MADDASIAFRASSIALACFCVLGCDKKSTTPKSVTPDAVVAPAKAPAIVIKVVARKWAFTFEYPNGVESEALHVPIGEPVALDLTSVDVVHTLDAPGLGVAHDAVPGKTTRVTITASKAGSLAMTCTAACGMPEPMTTPIFVEELADFTRFMTGLEQVDAPPLEVGRKVYETKGCASCHSIDGTKQVGAPLNGLWGTTITLFDGSTATVDEPFLRRALDDPQTTGQQGYPPSMPSYKGMLSDAEITGLAAYLASLK